MHEIETILGLLIAVAAVAWLATQLKVPYPILLVLAGLGIGFIPGLPRVGLRPDVVFLLFLPPLLYYAGLLTSWRDFRRNLRPISLLAVALVLFTTFVVAAVAHWVIGLGWGPAVLLGAIVSPPDAVAATAITQRLRVPRRVVILLEGESLLNDATALVAYRVTLIAILDGFFSLWQTGVRFLLVGAGGVVIGYVAARLVVWVRPRIRDWAVESIVSLLTPFVAYLPAEWAGASGVLAVVTAGLYVGRRLPQITSSQSRLRLFGVWETLVFLMNGMIFILIGLQLPVIVENLSAYPLATLIGYAALVTLACVAARLLWVLPATYVPRLMLPRLRARDPFPPFPETFLVAWVGLRGIVSLAAALALPFTLRDRTTPFPGRDLILFLTFGVILGTLVLQGLTLPWVIRALGLRQDGGDREDEYEEALARLETAHAALARLEVLGFTNEDARDLIGRVRTQYEERVRYLADRVRVTRDGGPVTNGDGHSLPDESPFAAPCRSTDEIQRHAITAEREMLVRLRDDGAINDEVLRRIQQELDHEESRLAVHGEAS